MLHRSARLQIARVEWTTSMAVEIAKKVRTLEKSRRKKLVLFAVPGRFVHGDGPLNKHIKVAQVSVL